MCSRRVTKAAPETAKRSPGSSKRPSSVVSAPMSPAYPRLSRKAPAPLSRRTTRPGGAGRPLMTIFGSSRSAGQRHVPGLWPRRPAPSVVTARSSRYRPGPEATSSISIPSTLTERTWRPSGRLSPGASQAWSASTTSRKRVDRTIFGPTTATDGSSRACCRRAQPGRPGHGIVVEQGQEGALGDPGAEVDGGGEAGVDRAADDGRARLPDRSGRRRRPLTRCL